MCRFLVSNENAFVVKQLLVETHITWLSIVSSIALCVLSEVTSVVSRALDYTSTHHCDLRLRYLDNVDGDHPWSLD